MVIVVERPEIVVVGLTVQASFDELHTAVPAAWERLFARHWELPGPHDGRYAEVSRHLGDGLYSETIGVPLEPAALPDRLPDGLGVGALPPGRYLHHRHEGAVRDIAAGFQAMYEWAARHGLDLGDFKLDEGYSKDPTDAPHDLYISVV